MRAGIFPLLALSLVLCACTATNAAPIEPSVAVASSSSASSKAPVRKLQPISQPAAAKPMGLPPTVQLDVPFTSQAPLRDWNQPYQDACEETAVLNVIHFLENRPFTTEIANAEILDFTAKVEAMGHGMSIDMATLASLITQLYPQYEPVLSTDVSIESIKRLLAQGKPVIIPAAGRILANPYFSGDGPWYHMLVVTGYDGTNFYTNEVGTAYGERYPYPHALLVDAIHDWTGVNERITEGPKVLMTLKKRSE